MRRVTDWVAHQPPVVLYIAFVVTVLLLMEVAGY